MIESAMSELDANLNNVASFEIGQGRKDLRNQRSQLLQAVSSNADDHDADARGANVLLILDAVVHCQQRFESRLGHELEQFAVSLGGPPHVDDVMNVVSYEVALEGSRNTLIE